MSRGAHAAAVVCMHVCSGRMQRHASSCAHAAARCACANLLITHLHSLHTQIASFNNHHAGLAAWKGTNGAKALLRPGETRFATTYMLIERLVELWPKLDQLVASDEWKEMVRDMDARDKPKGEKIMSLVRSEELQSRLKKVRSGVICVGAHNCQELLEQGRNIQVPAAVSMRCACGARFCTASHPGSECLFPEITLSFAEMYKYLRMVDSQHAVMGRVFARAFKVRASACMWAGACMQLLHAHATTMPAQNV